MTKKQEDQILQQYGFGEIDLETGAKLLDVDEARFLAIYDIWKMIR